MFKWLRNAFKGFRSQFPPYPLCSSCGYKFLPNRDGQNLCMVCIIKPKMPAPPKRDFDTREWRVQKNQVVSPIPTVRERAREDPSDSCCTPVDAFAAAVIAAEIFSSPSSDDDGSKGLGGDFSGGGATDSW